MINGRDVCSKKFLKKNFLPYIKRRHVMEFLYYEIILFYGLFCINPVKVSDGGEL